LVSVLAQVGDHLDSPVYHLPSMDRGVQPHTLVDTEKSSGGSPWSRFEVEPLVLDALGAPGGGALSAASVRDSGSVGWK